MNRIIKFRAWDNGKMHGVGICDCCHDQEDVAHIWGTHGVDDECGGPNDKAIPLQYTGLKDCKGNDIWEGYILESQSHNYDHSHQASCFDKEGKEICDPVIRKRFVVKFGPFKLGHYEGAGFYLEDGNHVESLKLDDKEVIGNVFENPDLLK